ncbi:hypothetical protein GCM10022247_36100 [Allokutzneria multivorans]|uniref:Uncharacterized protein n=1 Tax=Allokutzneria multivorans TaxID=1142134 RepID=A0ABP7SEB4_9PSEU
MLHGQKRGKLHKKLLDLLTCAVVPRLAQKADHGGDEVGSGNGDSCAYRLAVPKILEPQR